MDDHLHVPRFDCAEIAFGVAPAFGQQPVPSEAERWSRVALPVVYFARPIPAGPTISCLIPTAR